MCVSLSTPEHPEGVQYTLVGEERHKKRKLVTEEGMKWDGECQQIYKWTNEKLQKNKSLSLKQQTVAHLNFYLPKFVRHAEVMCFDVYKEV